MVFEWLTATDDDGERRALLAWARSKAGGKSFRRWCFQVEGIHPNTGRDRKNRALAKIQANVDGRPIQHNETAQTDLLHHTHEMGDVPATVAEDVGVRDTLNSWFADDAFAPFMEGEPVSAFSWADKRNAQRRQREAAKRKQATSESL